MTRYRYRNRSSAILLGIASLLASVPALGFAGSASAAPASPPATHAKADALIDVTSGRLLVSHNGDREMKIASLTKIMTAIVAIEHGRLGDIVTVSKRAAGKEGSSLYLKAGEKIKLEDLLYGLMLRSGNDAATAIAEHVGGSLEGFVYLMNRKAEELGLAHTRFENPHGLDQQGHYSSANDLAVLTAYALHNDVFRKIVGTKVKTAPNPNETWDYKWVNKNKMLAMYEGADGVKTGYTKQALRCLVSSATRGGQQLVAVTLNDGNDWADHRRLLDYGFAHYPLRLVVQKGEPVAGYPYLTTADFRYPFSEGERDKLRIKLAPLASTSLDYQFGYRGKLIFRLDDRDIGTVALKAQPEEDSGSLPSNSRSREGRSGGSLWRWKPSLHSSIRALFSI
ncbi:D-alanyl-D-alanine carboxypeptidase family protein [Cohnella thermotolerans]|jgi:D-alanyl-D-alanine carboxypeptidase (penicillin-binding protein 5/6)|uniref:D-alanyl-D-alanine carboxypeptidase family protein n=1 Tax=Cohnella thermotolerans TaxID=329858 RepID=UPI0004115AF9|nr:D-alanyl-D-alanine carboxypeptidase family protein [Cohnella thermotolerans]